MIKIDVFCGWSLNITNLLSYLASVNGKKSILLKAKNTFYMNLLFSYGTLQLKKVQLASFNRLLKGKKDTLKGYRLEQLQITDQDVLSKSDQKFHPIAKVSENKSDEISGMLFEVTDQELAQADAYEVSDYKRIKVTFNSGKQGWIYVAKQIS